MSPHTPSAGSVAVRHALDQHAQRPGALLPVLHAIQDEFGHIPADGVPLIAAALNLSRAEVHGVVSYYAYFRSAPPGRHVVQICRAEACQACGAEALLAHAERVLGCDRHHTRADGAMTLEPVYCLGLCAMSPAMRIDERVHARLTPERLEQLLTSLEAPT